MHWDVGQTSPGPLPLTEAEGWAYCQQGPPMPQLAQSPQFSLESLDVGAPAQPRPAVGFNAPLPPPAREWHVHTHTHTQSEIVICVRVTPEGPSTVAGFKPGTVQTQRRSHIACERVLA